MNSREKKIFGLTLTASIAFCLVGCTNRVSVPQITEITRNTIVVDESGTVISYVVADFDKDYYVEEELAAMITQELIPFNEKMRGYVSGDVQPAILSDTYRYDGKIVVQYAFANGYVYGQYQSDLHECFTGTVAQAFRQGYLDEANLLSVSKGKKLDVTTNDKILDRQIVIWQDEVSVFVLGRPEYLSANVTLSEDMHTLKIQGADGEKGYCIMK